MVSTATIYGFIISAIFTIVVPVLILIVLEVKRKINGLPLLFGAGAFFLSQIVLRIPLLDILSLQSWFQAFNQQHYFLFMLALAFSAGLFEESARLGGALLLKKQRSFQDIISFGLGHAFCELIILIGLSHINNVIACVMINNGSLAAIPAETLEPVLAELAAVTSLDFALGLLERFSALVFHLFATLLVFTGVKRKKIRFYFMALLAHTVFNLMGVLLADLTGLVVTEMVLLAMAAAMGYYVIKHKDKGEEVDEQEKVIK